MRTVNITAKMQDGSPCQIEAQVGGPVATNDDIVFRTRLTVKFSAGEFTMNSDVKVRDHARGGDRLREAFCMSDLSRMGVDIYTLEFE